MRRMVVMEPPSLTQPLQLWMSERRPRWKIKRRIWSGAYAKHLFQRHANRHIFRVYAFGPTDHQARQREDWTTGPDSRTARQPYWTTGRDVAEQINEV